MLKTTGVAGSYEDQLFVLDTFSLTFSSNFFLHCVFSSYSKSLWKSRFSLYTTRSGASAGNSGYSAYATMNAIELFYGVYGL